MKKETRSLEVLDIFCGAGGFSEGFRQCGFTILGGIDKWKPAIDTFNHNFGLNCKPIDILNFEKKYKDIELLPDTDVIIGSPPCVSFSSSNKSGKADKSLGVKLTETFFRIIAIKKHKPGSILKAWFMENVANSKKHLKDDYTFRQLKLARWANSNDIDPDKIAITLKNNKHIINSADYGSIQIRKRLITGEIIANRHFILPTPTHSSPKNKKDKLPDHKPLNLLRKSFPSPFEIEPIKKIKDPLYGIEIDVSDFTDHFYDTGIFEIEWHSSRFLKQNHPYMGRMSFPEDTTKPSRTITATKIANSRESIIYRSELIRTGNGEYRTPTIREAATIMGFPITYQFLGSENTKWKLVGNAVCPHVSNILAKEVLRSLKLEAPKTIVADNSNLKGVLNLNSKSVKTFVNPPEKKPGARFRRHPFKDGNMTVTLSNYDIMKNDKIATKWMTSAQFGTGEGFPSINYPNGYYKKLQAIIKNLEGGEDFLNRMRNGFSEKIADAKTLQKMYEKQKSFEPFEEPSKLVEQVADIINNVTFETKLFEQKNFFVKKVVPKKQIFALYAINWISSIANKKLINDKRSKSKLL